MSVFLDTGYFVGLAKEEDKNNKKAAELSLMIKDGILGNAYTSTYVVDETLTLISSRHSHELAVKIGEAILNSEVAILDIHTGTFQKSWALFKQKSGLSFTDCTTVKILQANNIRNLASFDRHFKEFNVLS